MTIITMKVLDASLAHLPISLAEQILDDNGDGSPFSCWVARPYGAFVYVTEREILADPFYGLPDSVIKLFDYAREQGCDYIRFDCDAEPIDGFELYDSL